MDARCLPEPLAVIASARRVCGTRGMKGAPQSTCPLLSMVTVAIVDVRLMTGSQGSGSSVCRSSTPRSPRPITGVSCSNSASICLARWLGRRILSRLMRSSGSRSSSTRTYKLPVSRTAPLYSPSFSPNPCISVSSSWLLVAGFIAMVVDSNRWMVKMAVACKLRCVSRQTLGGGYGYVVVAV